MDHVDELVQLARQLTQHAHALAPGNEHLQLALLAKNTLKASFDRALESETLSFPHLSTLLASLVPSAGIATRSSTRTQELAQKARLELSKTPLLELAVEDGMEPEMIWEQMEMRNSVVVGLLEEMFGGERDGSREDREGLEGETGEEGEADSQGEDSESEEEELEDNSEDDYEDGKSGSDEEDTNEGEDLPFVESEYVKNLTTAVPSPHDISRSPTPPTDLDPTSALTLATFDNPSSSTTSSKGRKASGPPSSVDSGFFSLHDFHVQTDEGEFEMNKAMRGEYDADDDDEEEGGIDLFAAVQDEAEEEEDLDGAGIMYGDFFEPPPRPFKEEKRPAKGKKGKGINPKPVSAPTPIVAGSSSTILSASTSGGKRSVKFSEIVKVKAIPARGSEFDKLVAKVGWEKAEEITKKLEAEQTEDMSAEDEDQTFGQDEDDEEGEMDEGEEDEMLKMLAEEQDEMMDDEDDEEEDLDAEEGSEEYESDDEEGRETIARLKQSLFEEDELSEDEDVTPAAKLSKHERRLLALSTQIADLEAENVGAKNWATKGEAKSRDRPVNSLLEEDLEYERSGKVVPVITEETTKGIEELIKKRIIDNEFDDVIRQREIDPNAFLPSRFMELQDSKSQKSLAEIYEDEYSSSKIREAGGKVVAEVDKDLEKKHSEIEELFEELSGKLDALSNARFTPKPPKASITTITNVSSITLESSLPTGQSVSTLLAPEETFVPDPTNEDRSDFTPSMKKQARQKRRKARASMAAAAEKFSKGTKGEKERAEKLLVGTKGVTVIGKSAAKGGLGKRKRGAEDEGTSGRSGVGLKL